MLRSTLASFFVVLSLAVSPLPCAARETLIVCPVNQPKLIVLSAREIQRYVYQRCGTLLRIAPSPASGLNVITVGVDGALKPQQYRLRSRTDGQYQELRITGGTPVATLYGAYRLAELLGVRFYLHADVIPDQRAAWRVPQVDITEEPLFEHRGIQPFHDFTEGPDWWSIDDYKSYFTQLTKLRMNWFGLHCYPEGGVGPEPLVWIGLAKDVNADGTVNFSYPSRWASTAGGAWGYATTKTSQYSAGAGQLFEDDDYGPAVTAGYRPLPTTPEDCNVVFNRTGKMMGDVFAFGRALGIKMCLGTETPLTIPKTLAQHLAAEGHDPQDPATVEALYAGMFTRIARAYPVDYYWLWTPEGWTWSGVKTEQVERTLTDVRSALKALEATGSPFGFATCGWVLGPPSDRGLFDKQLPKSVALSCINRQVGFSPVEPGFAQVEGRPQWAIPWMEDDPALTVPQLWVGRMRRDAADALGYGCTGLMGIHWRTKVLGPNVAALAAAGWQQRPWNQRFGQRITLPEPQRVDVHVGGNIADYVHNQIADTPLQRVYQSCRYNVQAYRVKVPNGEYRVTLKFCEIHYTQPGKRVFGVKLQGKPVVDQLDVFAKVGQNRPHDLSFDSVQVNDGLINIEFVKQVEYPFIAGIEISGPALQRRINCGGAATGGFTADLTAADAEVFPDLPRDLPCADFYRDWCRAQFGVGPDSEIVQRFLQVDGGTGKAATDRGTRLPRPATWVGGPGAVAANQKPWAEEMKRYEFVGRLEALRDQVHGAGNLARYNYWLNTFRYLRTMGRLGCRRGELDRLVQQIDKEPNAEAKVKLAEAALGVRIDMATDWQRLISYQVAVVSTPGELGTIANLEQHSLRQLHFLNVHDAKLRAVLQLDLPLSVTPSKEYSGPPRVIVPTQRTQAITGEALTIRILAPSTSHPTSLTLYWRPLGTGPFAKLACRHVRRAVFVAQLPPAHDATIEYYVEGRFGKETIVSWPPTAPAVNHTVVVIPKE